MKQKIHTTQLSHVPASDDAFLTANWLIKNEGDVLMKEANGLLLIKEKTGPILKAPKNRPNKLFVKKEGRIPLLIGPHKFKNKGIHDSFVGILPVPGKKKN